MKWVLIYIIMTTTHGATSVVQEFDDLTACEFAWETMSRNLSHLRTHDDKFKTTTIVTCLPKGSE